MTDLHAVFASLRGTFITFLHRLPELVLAVVVFFLFLFGARWLRNLIQRLAGKKSSNLGLVLGRLAQGALVLLGTLVALMIALPSFKPGQLVEFLGIGSVAVGFAFRDILQNFLAGIIILLTEPFRIGDQIVVSSYEGQVENIETRATFLKMYDGRRVVIPNSTLFTDSVTVNTAFDLRRQEYDIGIGYGDDIRQAQDLILKILHANDSVLKEPAPDALVVDLAASTVNIRARWWVAPRQSDVLRSRSDVLTSIKEAFGEAGIDLPLPTSQVLFHDQTEETDGDRTQQREGWPARKSGNPHSRFQVQQRETKDEMAGTKQTASK